MTAPAHQRDLTVGPVARTLFLFALPSLGVNILQSLNNSVNSIWIGQFLGEEALAASANAGLIMFLMFSALFGFSMATTILIGQNMGRRDVESVRRVMGTATGVFFVSGAVIAVFGWIFAPNLLRLMATPEGAYPLALAYLRVMFLSMPTSFVMVLISSSLRGVGDSVTPFWNTVLNVGLDIILNPVFILGFGPVPAMGIAGSALATLIASIISLALLIRKVYAKDLTIRLRGAELKWIRPDARFLKPIARMGLPMGLSMIIMSGSAVVMIGLVNREGVDTTAAFGVMNQLWSYVQMPAVAVGSAVSAMVAQNIGANNWARVDRAVWSGIVINLIMSGILVLLTTVFATPLLGLFLPEGSPAIAIAIHINHVIGWSFILMGISVVVTFAVRANGAVLAPLLILIFSAIVVRFSVGYGLHDRFGADAIWGAFIATSIVSCLLSISYYLHGSWRKAKAMSFAPPAETAPAAE
jgi:putative MATE family efflux protein